MEQEEFQQLPSPFAKWKGRIDLGGEAIDC